MPMRAILPMSFPIHFGLYIVLVSVHLVIIAHLSATCAYFTYTRPTFTTHFINNIVHYYPGTKMTKEQISLSEILKNGGKIAKQIKRLLYGIKIRLYILWLHDEIYVMNIYIISFEM